MSPLNLGVVDVVVLRFPFCCPLPLEDPRLPLPPVLPPRPDPRPLPDPRPVEVDVVPLDGVVDAVPSGFDMFEFYDSLSFFILLLIYKR